MIRYIPCWYSWKITWKKCVIYMFIWKWWWQKKYACWFDSYILLFEPIFRIMLLKCWYSIQNIINMIHMEISQIMILWNEFSIEKNEDASFFHTWFMMEKLCSFLASIFQQRISMRIECKEEIFSLWFNFRSYFWITHLWWDDMLWKT